MNLDPQPIVGDALGTALLAHLEEGKEAGTHIVERDDGYVEADSADVYFSRIGEWFTLDEPVPSQVTGRVLDIGAGAGRFAIDLQSRGHDVVALDVSDGCLEVCRRLGVEQTFSGTVFDLGDTGPEPFDTFLLMGHNLGLLSGPDHAPRFFDALRRIARPGAKIIGTNRDPLSTVDPVNLGYHQRNRDRGRPPGQLTIRVRFRNVATPWFDYWFLPIEELEQLAAASGWQLANRAFEGGSYLAELLLG